jgi:hypothetical protein
MSNEKLQQIQQEIQNIKDELMAIGEMRPGSLTLQYKEPKEKRGPYYQISYTQRMRSRTQYVRSDRVEEIRHQIDVYRRFKKLIERWIELAIEHSQLKMKLPEHGESGK